MMRTVFLAGALLALLPAQAATTLAPQFIANHTAQSQDYLGESITLTLDSELTEGILGYANIVAQGNKVTAIASQQGIAIYSVENNKYQLLHEVRLAELGLNYNDHIESLIISEADLWLIYVVNGKAITLTLDQQYKPQLNSRSEFEIGYVNNIQISNGVLALNYGHQINTFAIDNSTGVITTLDTLNLSDYASHMGLANGVLTFTQYDSDTSQHNLQLYRLDNSGQWQQSASHTLPQGPHGGYSPNYAIISPSGQNIIYGNSELSIALSYAAETNQLSETFSGDFLTGYYYDIRFLDEVNILLSTGDQLAVFDSQTLQTKSSYNLDQFNNSFNNVAVHNGSIVLLNESGLTQLSPDTLQVSAAITASQQGRMLNFVNYDDLTALNNDFMLKITGNQVQLFQPDTTGIPKLTQSGSTLKMLGFDRYYSRYSSHHFGDNVYVILGNNSYSVLKLNTETAQLQLLNSGTLRGRNASLLYSYRDNVTHSGNYLLHAHYDTLTLLQLTSNHQIQFVDAAVNGASGINGITNIQLLFSVDNHIYAADAQNQQIAHFTIDNNRLQQKNLYSDLYLPYLSGKIVHGNVVTLLGYPDIHSFSVAADGTLSLNANQNLPEAITQWTTIGQRFMALKLYTTIQIMELDHTSGVWHTALVLNSQQLCEEYNLSQSSLLPLANNLSIYDARQKRLIRLAHNSSPYVPNQAALSLSFNQGQPTQLAVSSLFADEEDATLTFSLSNAADSFSLTDDNLLHFNGQAASSGSMNITAEDEQGLAVAAQVNYQVNLAPVAKATLPVFSTTAGDAIQFELAQHFTDPEGQALQFALASAQAGLTLSSTGLLTGTLNSAGELSLSVNISDSTGAVSNHTVQISVAAKPAESSGGGSLHWLLLSLLACTALCRVTSRR
ncbi:Ig-like domain-containing protein [Rheinheimera sp. NSM]|uniref:Ig-like domain-containing protein n=1 Tax=Rheinheimera sp. NSM TaxID=3457884 RepID=UPI004036CEB3